MDRHFERLGQYFIANGRLPRIHENDSNGQQLSVVGSKAYDRLSDLFSP